MFRRREDEFDVTTEGAATPADDIVESTASEAREEITEPAAAARPATASTAAPSSAASPSAAPASAFRPQPASAASSMAARPMPMADNRNAPAATSAAGGVSANPKASKRVLTVGNDIHMKGEISTCDRLVIEGSVDATLKDVHTVELAQSGSFKGTAEIQDAEISGIFEGDLIVNGRLIIYSTGQVNGSVSYGEIEIERGGRLTGTIKTAEQIKSERTNRKVA